MATLASLAQNVKAGAKKVFNQMATLASTPVNELIVADQIQVVVKLSDEEKRRQMEVLRARDFHQGRQGAKLTESLRLFMGMDAEEEKEFSLNFAATVTLAVAERLVLKGVVVAPEETFVDETQSATQNTWAARLLRRTRFAAKQADIHENALRDGEFFVVVDYDSEGLTARFHPHKRYTDPSVKVGDSVGDGEGVQMFYPGDDINQKPLFAAKRWVETEGTVKVKKICLYFPDKVSTWRLNPTGWVQESEVPWIGPKSKLPLGIPVVVFYTPGRKPESRRAWALQRVTNKLLLDLLQTVHVSAFRIWLYFGWSPKDANGNPLTISPNTWIGDSAKKSGDASATAIEGSAPAPIADVLDSIIFKMAALTDTPPSRLMVTRQVAAEGTLKQQNEPLIAKCRRRQANFSSSYEDLFGIARRLENEFGEGGLDEAVLLDADWEPLQARTAEEELAEVNLEKARVEVQVLKGSRGVSQKQSQRELDYSDKTIDQMAEEVAEEKSSATDGFARMFNAGAV